MKLPILCLIFSRLALATVDCDTVLAKTANGDLQWRETVTHGLSGGETFATDAAREKNVQFSMDLMKAEIEGSLWGNGHSDTPPMIVVPANGTSLDFTRKWEEYGDMHAEITGAKEGVLRATVLLPVSGHTGLANAKAWSKTDTYSLTYKDAQGKEISLVKDAPSLGLVTAQEVEIPLVDGKPVTLLYYRSGSGGPGGFAGGRVLHLTWKKAASQTPVRDFSKPFWFDASH